MKKIISILIIITVLFASVMTVIPAFADDDIIADESNDALLSENITEARAMLRELLDGANLLILTDYTNATAEELKSAIESAELVYANEKSEYSVVLDAISALNNAKLGLASKKADLCKLKLFYTEYKYSDTVVKYVQTELADLAFVVEEALANEKILISEVERIEKMIDGIPRVELVSSAEEFALMQNDGYYVLSSDIELTEPYGEFKGYLHGNGRSITVSNGAIFNSVNGATLIGFEINGNIISTQSVGALANEASGTVCITDVVNNAAISAELTASGFIAESNGANIFFNSCINNADINGGAVAGFVAKSIGEKSGNIFFEYCASLGNLSGKQSASAFFGAGNCNIEMYGCIAGGTNTIKASVEASTGNVGGVIGDICGGVNINACYFNLDVVSASNDGAASLVLCGTNVRAASVKNILALGSVTALNNNAYRLTSLSADKLITDNVLLDVSLMINGEGGVVENLNALDKTEKNDISAFDEESVNNANCDIMAFVWAVTSNAEEDLKREGTELFAKSLKIFKTPEQAELYREKNIIKEFIEIGKKAPDDYTADSYNAYMAEIEKIIYAIDSANKDELEAIDSANALLLAEKKLVTLEDARKYEEKLALDEAKAVALAILSAKRENAGKVFTKDSYSAYLKAFDDIVEKINSASDVAALEALDVPALKVAAENKLVVDIPELVEEEYDDDEKIEVEDNKEEENEENQNSASTEKNGCSASASACVFAITSLLGFALVRKKD